MRPPEAIRRGEPALWVATLIAALIAYTAPTYQPALDHDSFQYLSIADAFLLGHGGYTSLIHFDVERQFGTIPAPMVTFPSGYSAAIALVAQTGVSPPFAALLISALATCVSIWLLWWIACQMQLSIVARSVVAAAFVFNASILRFGSSVLSEALFTAVTLGALAMLLSARRQAADVWWPWIAAGALFGASYWVRYAGLFFCGGLVLLAIRYVLTREHRLAQKFLAAAGAAAVVVAPGFVRNYVLVGNWRGRDEMAVDNPMIHVLRQTADSFHALLLGPGTGNPGGAFLPKLLFLAALSVVIVAEAAQRFERVKSCQYRPPPSAMPLLDLVLMTVVYVGCMFYAGLTSSISYGNVRIFAPIAPMLLLCFAASTTSLGAPTQWRGLVNSALIVAFACYLFLNLQIFRFPRIDQASGARAQLVSSAQGGTSAMSAVRALGPTSMPIVANNGQAVGYVLGNPTISMVGPTYSNARWDEATLRTIVRRFHVGAVVISRAPSAQTGGDSLPSHFVEQLADGKAPQWLELVHRSNETVVYRPHESVAR